ncbi:rhodanese-like domain-containing protein [Ichthyenterobacterium sp. W332]|uniref:Rhodanese-like domain-containing protein n=1 Tax=Microcosmobacter mediterraneus TaxID=3075607 RepID=A0ABU2YN64_9FLAO|nr:rhodanese-like domain-containing protein [Ichthyenterobacterium sp. W332]MDT0559608.1 rhodanese-like domain-containing protein [Ichthyenterobacterium sp. W332]
MKKLITLLCITALMVSCAKEQKGEVKLVSPEEMQALIESEDVQLVDVRTPEEYSAEYIAHSQNIDYSSPTFEDDIKDLDKSKPVVLYCRSGGRSAKCAKKLKDAGFVKIYDLDGGISKWKHKGLEVKAKS